MLTGETIHADRAQAIGLVDECVDDAAALLPRAEAMAFEMGNNPQAALRMVKQLITENLSEQHLNLVQQRELAALETCYQSAEHHEAINAFIAKRPPNFKAARSKADSSAS